MHADRFLEGNKTITANFLNKPALFPAGPFLLARTFQVPVSFVFAMKDRSFDYHFYASPPKIYPGARETSVQEMLHGLLPGQWKTRSENIRCNGIIIMIFGRKIESLTKFPNETRVLDLIFIPCHLKSKMRLTLSPKKYPFVLVDKLIYVDENTSHGSFKIQEENIFVKSGFYSTSGMVESMAQTAAAGTGYLCRKNNKEVPIGYIGAVQKLEVMDWPPVNAEITMEITLLTNILQVSLVSGMSCIMEK